MMGTIQEVMTEMRCTAAEDDNGNSHDDEEADNRVDDGLMTFDDVIVDGRSHVVGLQAVESEAKAEDEGYGKDDTEPALTESKLNVVCGATTKRAVRIAHLPDLGKRRLDERRCRADDGHEPHPENGAPGRQSQSPSRCRRCCPCQRARPSRP